MPRFGGGEAATGVRYPGEGRYDVYTDILYETAGRIVTSIGLEGSSLAKIRGPCAN